MMRPWMRLLATLAILGTGASVGAVRFAVQTVDTPSAGGQQQSGGGESAEKKTEPPETGTPEPIVDPELKQALGSPRATIETFLDAADEYRLKDAAQCLDLSKLTATEEALETKKEELAYKLKEVLDKLTRIDVYQYTTAGEADEVYALADTQSFDEADEKIAEKIVIAQSTDGLWRFTPNTVLAIEKLHEELLDREKVETLSVSDAEEPEPKNVPFAIWLAEQFPIEMQKTHFLLPGYQWISLAAIVLLGLLADQLTRLALKILMMVWFRLWRRGQVPVIPNMWRPIGLLMQGVTWYVATKFIGLPTELLSVLLVGLRYFAVVAGVWTSFHLIDLAARIAARRASRTASRFDDVLVPLIATSLKIAATCIGIVLCIIVIDTKIGTMLAGLIGIGGMALAFASQDAISNLFGSLTVLLDRPFEVGDWIVADGVEGTVESVGFRSTRVRTFYNSLISIPNSRFTTSSVDNFGRRRYRRFKTVIGLQYDTKPEQLDAFCEGVRELIRRHPYTRKDYYHVYLNDLSDSALDVLLYCFFECPDWSIELRERHRLLVDVMRLSERLGVQFAFPTRTIQMFQGVPSSAEKSVDWSDPGGLGVREAMQIAGPAVSDESRPGSVEFRGPAAS